MIYVRVAFVGLLMVAILGCGALGASTDQAPGWVKTLDNALGVIKDQQGTQKTENKAADAASSIPVYGGAAGTILGILGYAWYTVRRLAGSVPSEVHQAAIDHLGNSTPTPKPTT